MVNVIYNPCFEYSTFCTSHHSALVGVFHAPQPFTLRRSTTRVQQPSGNEGQSQSSQQLHCAAVCTLCHSAGRIFVIVLGKI